MRWPSTLALVPVTAWWLACGNATSAPDHEEPLDASAPAANDAAGTIEGAAPPPDASAPADAGAARDAAPPTVASCMQALLPASAISAFELDYEQFHPTMSPSCAGTRHQRITGVERVVFLGDSVTAGTPPTPANQFYANVLTAALVAKFGQIEVQNCAQWGATTVDLLGGMKEIAACFPSGLEPKKTLIVMTVGSNNLQDWALAQPTVADAMARADVAAGELRDAIRWLKDPARFPNGSYVVFADPYEYTDGTGDLGSCFAAQFLGLKGNVGYLFPAIAYFEERFMKVAVETGTDLMFLYEHFCGHGYHDTDPGAPCYRGAGADLWFDVSCAHPTPAGHGKVAQLFLDVVSP